MAESDTTVVDRLHTEFSDLIDFLDRNQEPSRRNVADEHLKKAFLMAVASYFERCMTNCVTTFVEEVTSQEHVISWLIRNKVVSRQYHTWFDWSSRNANRFFSLFGDRFRDYARKIIADDQELESSIHAFMELGRERNRLVHQDFGSFPLDKNTEEIYALYSAATKFVDWFPRIIHDFSQGANE